MRSAYGIKVKDENDPYVQIAEEGLNVLNAGINAGMFIVNDIPIRESQL